MAGRPRPNSERLLRLGGQILPWTLLALHAGLLLNSIRLHSVCTDEAAHIPSGLIHWHAGTYAAYRVNPPTPRMLATLPLLATGCQWVDDEPEKYSDPFARNELNIRKPFFDFNRTHYHDFVFLSRIAGVFWSCLGGILIFQWARELCGYRGAILSLVLWCFDPTILAYAQIVTPDLPCAVAGLWAMYTFRRYLQNSVWPAAVFAGGVLGIALLTKFTLLVLLPVCLVLLIVSPRIPDVSTFRTWRVRAGHAALALVAMLLVVNLAYLFEGSGRRLGEIPFVSRMFAGPRAPLDPKRGAAGAAYPFRDTWLGSLPSPVPEDWLRGIDVQRRDFEEFRNTRPSYLAGKWRDGGWWYYYVVALAIKLPLGTIVLILAGMLAAMIRRRCSASWREELAIYLPALAIITLVSSQTGFNHHMRYVLPALPFLFVGTAKLGSLLNGGSTSVARPESSKGVAGDPRPSKTQGVPPKLRRMVLDALIVGCVLWSTVSSLSFYPHSMSYFNEAVGGPENGHAYLVDSNIDWGQDLFFLKRWLDQHPEARGLRTAVYNSPYIVRRVLEIEPLPPPSGL